MKVKDLIKLLEGLDQERNIWVRYDGVYFLTPSLGDGVSEFEAEEYKDQYIKEGDYCL
jgi:hypothetical protein